MAINRNEIADRVCLLAAAQRLLMVECEQNPDQEQYLAVLLYLVQAQVKFMEDALTLVSPSQTLAEFCLFMLEWARDKYDPAGHIISDLPILDLREIDSLPNYFVGICVIYSLALGNETEFHTGNKPVNECGRFMASLINLLALAETVLAKEDPQHSHVPLILEYERQVKQSVGQQFFPNGVPRTKCAGDAFLMSLGFTFSGVEGQHIGISDLQHLTTLMIDAGMIDAGVMSNTGVDGP